MTDIVDQVIQYQMTELDKELAEVAETMVNHRWQAKHTSGGFWWIDNVTDPKGCFSKFTVHKIIIA